MVNKQPLALFDYETLDLDTRSFVQTKTTEIRILVKQTAQGIIEIGQRLIEVKERLPHGEFLPWIRDEFGWSRETAHRFIHVAENFPQIAHCVQFQMRALYLLASPSTPESARDEALTLAESGERITHQAAQEIIAKHKAEAEAAKTEAKAAQKEIIVKQQAITELTTERLRMVQERDRFRLTKQDDDQCIVRLDNKVNELNQQIEQSKTQVVEPRVIMQEVRVEIEKRIEVVPEDYEQLKEAVVSLKEKLKTSRQKSGEELSQYQAGIKELTDKLAKKEELLASFDVEQKQLKALRKLKESHSNFREASNLLTSQHLSNLQLKETINTYLQDFVKDFNKFLEKVNTIDIDIDGVEADYVESNNYKSL